MKIRSLLTLLFGILLLAQTFGQKVDVEKLKGLEPRSIGPAGMSGRINSIDADPRNTDILYIGSASGGVWKSVNGGINWSPIFDDQPILSIGAVAVTPSNPDIIWAGTGEGNPRNSHNSGAGIYKSLDGGKTWKLMGLEKTKTIHRVLVHPNNPNVVYVGAMGSIWGPNPERGVYKTTDGGKTWKQILYNGEGVGVADMVMDPTNPEKLIVAMWEYDRDPWQFTSGGSGSGMYVTLDGGENWMQRTSKEGLPEGDLGRLGLAIAPSKPNIVYALVEAKDNFLYKSTDGGATWSKANNQANEGNISNRPFYYHDIFVDPQNENRIFNLYSSVSMSEDGGKTFQTMRTGTHSDHHAFWIDPNNPKYMILGTDGGLFISRDAGDKWMFCDNIPVGQFYHVNVDNSIPYKIGGGMQDNGSWVGENTKWKRQGIMNTDWQEVMFGDGFDLSFHPSDSRYIYAMSQGGNVGFVDTKTGKSTSIRPTHPDINVELRFNWNAALAQNPFHANGVYYGSQFLHKSMDNGQSWEIISPDLTTNDKEKQDLSAKTGGLTYDITGAENFTTILAIGPSPVDENVIWVGTDDGNVQLTRDGGKTWTNLAAKLPGMPKGSWIPQIEVSTKNAGEAFIVVNDYRRSNWEPMIYHTSNYGQTFKRIVDTKQVSGYALCVVQDPVEPNLLFVGTDHGLWFSIDMGVNWNKWTKGFPSVQVADLKIHPRDNDLVIGTFGRSFWILDDISPLRALAATKGEVLQKPLALFAATDAYLAEYQSNNGYHFPVDGLFQGENERPGANMTLWVGKQPEGKARPEATADAGESAGFGGRGGGFGGGRGAHRIQMAVYNMEGEKVRDYTMQVDSGMNQIAWDMRFDGGRYPSRQAPRADANTPGGAEALPGKYKVVVNLGKMKDSTMVTIHEDPRISIPMADRKAKVMAYKEMYEITEMAADAADRIREAKSTIKTVSQATSNADKEVKKEITDMGKKLEKSLTEMEEAFFGKEDVKGIFRSSDNINSYLGNMRRYIGAGDGAPTQAAKRAMEFAEAKVSEMVKKLNAFLETDFAAYQKKVEAAQYSLFKTLDPVKMGG